MCNSQNKIKKQKILFLSSLKIFYKKAEQQVKYFNIYLNSNLKD